MTRRRIFAASFAGLLLTSSACAWVAGLDPVTYGAVDGGGGAVEGGGGGDVEAGSAEAASDASGADGDRDSAPDPCDRDHDGVRSNACGGPDCDDNDPRIHPDAAFSTELLSDGGADWNCDGVESKQYSHQFGSCSVGPTDADCFSRSGYVGSPPPCAATAAFTLCADDGGGCRPLTLGQPQQEACR